VPPHHVVTCATVRGDSHTVRAACFVHDGVCAFRDIVARMLSPGQCVSIRVAHHIHQSLKGPLHRSLPVLRSPRAADSQLAASVTASRMV